MKHPLITALVCVTIASLYPTLCLGAYALPKSAKLVPTETVLLIEVDNFAQLQAQFERTDSYKLYRDPAMAAFVEKAKTKLQEKIQQFDDNNIFKVFFNTDTLPKGRLAVALVITEQTIDANQPPLLVITQWGEKIDTIKEAISKMAEKNIELGGHQKISEDYRGTQIETLVDEEGVVINYCFFDDCLLAATDAELLKFAIAQIKGASTPTLADDNDYTATIAAVGPHHDINLYVNIKQIIKTITAEDTTGNIQRIIGNLGFDNVAGFGISMGISRLPGSSFSGKAFLKINGPKKGACKMLEAKSAAFQAPRFVPASTYTTTFFNLDIKRAFDELAKILNNFSPQAASIMYTPLIPPSPDGGPTVQLKGDIIDHLGSGIVLAETINKPFSLGTMPRESLVALAVDNRAALEKSMSLLHSEILAPNNPDARRELLGYTIYLVKPEILPFFNSGLTPMQNIEQPNSPEVPLLAFTITNTHLIFGNEKTVEHAVRLLSSKTNPLASAKWFNLAKAAIPSVVGISTIENTAVSAELFWWFIKESGKADGASMLPGPLMVQLGPKGLGQFVDFSLLPNFDAVRKYFGASVFYGISRPDGFFFEFKGINQNQL